jgi:hypothetical protein
MCTQEIVWCSCGHGELLPIIKCSQAEAMGFCFTVIHGDHRVVLQMKCSYCIAGLSKGAPLGTKARPEGELAAMIERESEGHGLAAGLEDTTEANPAAEVPWGLDEMGNVDWAKFDLDPELWQYV